MEHRCSDAGQAPRHPSARSGPPPAGRTLAKAAWARRWWSVLSVAFQHAVGHTALGRARAMPGPAHTDAPDLSEVLDKGRATCRAAEPALTRDRASPPDNPDSPDMTAAREKRWCARSAANAAWARQRWYRACRAAAAHHGACWILLASPCAREQSLEREGAAVDSPASFRAEDDQAAAQSLPQFRKLGVCGRLPGGERGPVGGQPVGLARGRGWPSRRTGLTIVASTAI